MPKDRPPESALVKPDDRGTVTIPEQFRADWDADKTVLEVTLRDDGVIELRPRVLVDPAQLAGYAEWESRRDDFFRRWHSIAEEASVPTDEAEGLAAEAVRATRQGVSR